VSLYGTETRPTNLIVDQTLNVIVIRELNSNIRCKDGQTDVTSHLYSFIYFMQKQKTQKKVIGEPWFPGLTLKTVLNVLQAPFNCCLFNTSLQVRTLVN
jgi:hypothetical protein